MKDGRVRIGRTTHVPSSALASGYGETWCGVRFMTRHPPHDAKRVSDLEEVDCMACIAENAWKGL